MKTENMTTCMHERSDNKQPIPILQNLQTNAKFRLYMACHDPAETPGALSGVTGHHLPYFAMQPSLALYGLTVLRSSPSSRRDWPYVNLSTGQEVAMDFTLHFIPLPPM